MPLTISIGTDITKTWAEYCSKHCDVPGELSHPHRDVATQTGGIADKYALCLYSPWSAILILPRAEHHTHIQALDGY